MQSLSVGTNTGLPLDPMVGLGILSSVSGNRQIRKRMSENKLVRKT